MKTLTLTAIAMFALSSSAFADEYEHEMSHGWEHGRHVNLEANLTWLNVGYTGGPNVVGTTAIGGNVQTSNYAYQSADSETENTDTTEGTFVKDGNNESFTAGNIDTASQNVINSSVMTVSSTGMYNTLAVGANGVPYYVSGQSASDNSQDANAEAEYVMGGDITTTAVNFINTSRMDVTARSDYATGLAIGLNDQSADGNEQYAYADTYNETESYGDINTSAINVLNRSSMTVVASSHSGDAVALGVSSQYSDYNDQDAESMTTDSNTHGGVINTGAFNSINSSTMNVSAVSGYGSYDSRSYDSRSYDSRSYDSGALAVGLNVQTSYEDTQDAYAETDGVNTWGGSVSTTAANGINTSTMNVSASDSATTTSGSIQ